MMQWSFGNACLRNLTPYFADRRFFAIDVDSHLLMASEYVFFRLCRGVDAASSGENYV